MMIVTEACKSGSAGSGCPGSISYNAADRYHGGIEYCVVCDTGHEWDARLQRWRARHDLRLSRFETD
jgi:hypothetical protein